MKNYEPRHGYKHHATAEILAWLEQHEVKNAMTDSGPVEGSILDGGSIGEAATLMEEKTE